MRTTRHLIFMLLASITVTFSQPQFAVPLRIGDGLNIATLYFGIRSTGDFCFAPRDSVHGYSVSGFLPPVPPGGVFDARFICPRNSADPVCACFGFGLLFDLRRFVSATQRDTFRVSCQYGSGTTVNISWPAGLSAYFTALTLRYFDGSANVNIDMLSNSSVDVTLAGGPAGVHIFSGGLVFTSVGETSHCALEGFALNQNYPNPFNPTTTIRYSLPFLSINTAQGRAGVGSHVSLKVFDLLGRELATLVEGEQEPGEHVVEWTPEGVASGVYIYRLTTISGTVSRKMLLLR